MQQNNGGITMPLWGIVLPPTKKLRDPAAAWCAPLFRVWIAERAVEVVCFFVGSSKPAVQSFAASRLRCH